MKEDNEKAKELYKQAKAAGLEDIAEDIKKKYVITPKAAQPIKTWFKEWFSQSHFISVLLRASNNTNEPYQLYAKYRQYQQELEGLAAKCIEDIGLENILLNSEDKVTNRYNAWKIAKWNYDTLTKYAKNKLSEYGFKQFDLKDVVVNINNMHKFAVAYFPANNERAFTGLNLIDLFQWAHNNKSQGYENMTVWMKD